MPLEKLKQVIKEIQSKKLAEHHSQKTAKETILQCKFGLFKELQEQAQFPHAHTFLSFSFSFFFLWPRKL